MTKRRSERASGMIIAIVALIVVIGSVGGLLAKYRTEQLRKAEMVAADFHFSAEYLAETKFLRLGETVYTISGWTDGITLELYNYEKENPALVSALDVTYEVTVDSEQFEVVNGNGELKTGEKNSATVTILPKENTDVTAKELTVTVHTTPYDEGLTAKFKLVGEQNPRIEVANNGTHYTAKIYANHYSGTITLKWAESLIPDATNDIVQNWENGVFTVEPFRTYEIIFFNPSNVSEHGITLE